MRFTVASVGATDKDLNKCLCIVAIGNWIQAFTLPTQNWLRYILAAENEVSNC